MGYLTTCATRACCFLSESGFPLGIISDSSSGPAWMTRPYSEHVRERALIRADAGETVRSIAEALQISPSCVTKWKNLRRDTGSLSPGKIGGHKKPVCPVPMPTGCAGAFARGHSPCVS
jgi:hypothetical protein